MVCPIPFALFLEARFVLFCQSSVCPIWSVRMIAVQNGGLRIEMEEISIGFTISWRVTAIPYAKVSRDAPGVGTCCAVGTDLRG